MNDLDRAPIPRVGGYIAPNGAELRRGDVWLNDPASPVGTRLIIVDVCLIGGGTPDTDTVLIKTDDGRYTSWPAAGRDFLVERAR